MQGFQWFFRSQAIIFPLKIGSKWVPNRIIDSERVRKPLDRHGGRYHSALRAILAALGRVLSAMRSPKVGTSDSNPPTTEREQPAGRGWGGDKSLSPRTGGEEGLAPKKDNSNPLHALRRKASADDLESNTVLA